MKVCRGPRLLYGARGFFATEPALVLGMGVYLGELAWMGCTDNMLAPRWPVLNEAPA